MFDATVALQRNIAVFAICLNLCQKPKFRQFCNPLARIIYQTPFIFNRLGLLWASTKVVLLPSSGYFSGRYFFLLYHFAPWLIRPDRPLRHRRSGVPAFASIAPQRYRAPPWRRRSPWKIHPWIFQGLQNCVAILHVAESPSMAFYWLASTKKIPPWIFFRIRDLQGKSLCC